MPRGHAPGAGRMGSDDGAVATAGLDGAMGLDDLGRVHVVPRVAERPVLALLLGPVLALDGLLVRGEPGLVPPDERLALLGRVTGRDRGGLALQCERESGPLDLPDGRDFDPVRGR